MPSPRPIPEGRSPRRSDARTEASSGTSGSPIRPALNRADPTNADASGAERQPQAVRGGGCRRQHAGDDDWLGEVDLDDLPSARVGAGHGDGARWDVGGGRRRAEPDDGHEHGEHKEHDADDELGDGRPGELDDLVDGAQVRFLQGGGDCLAGVDRGGRPDRRRGRGRD